MRKQSLSEGGYLLNVWNKTSLQSEDISVEMISLSGYTAFYFVDADNSRQTDSMKCAFILLAREGFAVSWKDQLQLTQLAKNNQHEHCYVIESFEGRVFNFLKMCEVNMLGPNCILHCIQYKEMLVRRNYPVKSYCMRHVVVTTSGLCKQQRDELSRKVLLMGGKFCKEITNKTTHIVSKNVMTRKCQQVREKMLPIMKPEWINDSYEKCHTNIFKAASNEFSRKYKLPIFSGTIISVSQLSNDKRIEVQKMVVKNGGSYSASLNPKTTSHLILDRPEGEKYKHAKATNKIFIVNFMWLRDSVDKGQIQNEKEYLIDSCTDINRNGFFVVPETSSRKCDENQKVSHTPRIINTEVSVASASELSQLVCGSSDLFDGYNILIIGCDDQLFKNLKRLISISHGNIYMSPKDAVTHVVVGPNTSKTELDEYKTKLPDISHRFIRFEWIIECVTKSRIVNHSDYSAFHVQNSSLAVRNSQTRNITPQLSISVNEPSISNEQRDNNSFLTECTTSEKNDDNVEHDDDEEKPLSGCVITFSSIPSASEKDKLKEIATKLGACCQDYFSKKDIPAKNFKRNTHLIVAVPRGDKFKMSQEWEIPCVSTYWLYKCLELNRKEEVDDYIMKDENIQNDNLLERLEGYQTEFEVDREQTLPSVPTNPLRRNHFGDLVRKQINDELPDTEISDSADDVPVTWLKHNPKGK